MVEPLLVLIAASTNLTVYTQDDPTFPESVPAIHDSDLAISWHHYDRHSSDADHRGERSRNRSHVWLVARLIGNDITGLDDLGEDLPVMRPGCGSMSVDPDRVDAVTRRVY